jgi:phage recombination protein Bet
MSTALSRANNGALAVGEQYGYDAPKVQLIKDLVAVGASDNELALFLYTAQRTGLDPLAKQIYCIKRQGKMTIQTGIDGYRLIADRTGNYAPGRAPTYEYDADSKVYSATAYVMKYVRGTWHEVSATAFWDEYVVLYNGQPGNLWASKPRVMLAKCAEALALRRAFPAELSGLYTDTEMGDTAPATVDGQFTVDDAPRPPAAPDTTLLINDLRGLRKQLHTLGLPLKEMTIGEMRAMPPDELQLEIDRERRRLEMEEGKLAEEDARREMAEAGA